MNRWIRRYNMLKHLSHVGLFKRQVLYIVDAFIRIVLQLSFLWGYLFKHVLRLTFPCCCAGYLCKDPWASSSMWADKVSYITQLRIFPMLFGLCFCVSEDACQCANSFSLCLDSWLTVELMRWMHTHKTQDNPTLVRPRLKQVWCNMLLHAHNRWTWARACKHMSLLSF